MSLDRDISLLQQVPILAAFSGDQLRLLAFSAETRKLQDGETLFHAGERAESGFLVVEGEIDLVRESSDSRQVVESLGVGSLMGEMAMITDADRPITAVSRGPAEVIQIRRALFRRIMEEYPDLAARLQSYIAGQVQKSAAEFNQARQALIEPEISR